MHQKVIWILTLVGTFRTLIFCMKARKGFRSGNRSRLLVGYSQFKAKDNFIYWKCTDSDKIYFDAVVAQCRSRRLTVNVIGVSLFPDSRL